MDNYCRICIRSDGFEKISLTTVSQIGGIPVDDMLVFCSQLEITTEDGLPQQICTECLAALNSTFLFRKLCYRSNATFREMLQKLALEQNVYIPPEPQKPPLPTLVPIVQELPTLEPIAHDDPFEITIKEELLESDEFLDSAVNEYNESLAVDEERTTEDTDRMKEVKVQKRKTLRICDKCGYSTRFPANFTRHKRMKQDCALAARVAESKKQLLRTMKALSDPALGNPKVYSCDVCEYSSHNKYNFRRHQKTFRHYTAENTQQENTQYAASISDDAEVLPESSKPDAGKSITKQNHMPLPQILDESEGEKTSVKFRKEFYCEDCGFQNHSRANFTRHQEVLKHTNFHTFKRYINRAFKLKKHVCPKCGQRRASENTLKRHMAKCGAVMIKDQEAVKHTDNLDAIDSLERDTMMVEPNPTESRTSFNDVDTADSANA